VRTEFDDEFAEFVTRWSPALLRVAFLLTSDRGEAEDLLQTALLKTSRHWGRLADREAAYAYVRRVLVTTHTSWRRRRRVHEVFVDRLPDAPVDQPAGVEAGRALQALEELPPRMRAVVVLRCYEGLTEAETAAALGCSLGSVKSQASRGLARLRALLDLTQTAPFQKSVATSEGAR
jgi:RNA polymerase sigma-70 factor (sigma-E family)